MVPRKVEEKPEPLMTHLPGSQYLRGYCSSCGEPMRVIAVNPKAVCSTCSGEATMLSVVAEGCKNRGIRKTPNVTK